MPPGHSSRRASGTPLVRPVHPPSSILRWASLVVALGPFQAPQGPGAVRPHEPPLKAVQLLEYRPPGVDARVRFEWAPVAGAREYRLVGRWTGAVSWAVHSREYAVTSRTATSWTPERVTLEVPLPIGNHSWQLVAVFGPADERLVGDATPLSFAVK